MKRGRFERPGGNVERISPGNRRAAHPADPTVVETLDFHCVGRRPVTRTCRAGGIGRHRDYSIVTRRGLRFDRAAMKYTLGTLRSILFAGLVGACGTLPGDGPSYDPVTANQARLAIATPALANIRAVHLKAVRDKAGYQVERASWDAGRGARAELMLIEALSAKGLEVPEDPRDELINFTGVVEFKANFGELYQSETAMGPAAWRRFVTGDRACVVFSQRWDGGANTPVIRTLFGYYCAAPGAAFTLQDAQSVLRTIRITAS